MADESSLDDDLAGLLLASVGRIDAWMNLFQNGVQAPQAGSSLAGDDRAAAPYQVSHRAFMALSHATDSLHLLRRAALRGEGNALELATSPYGAFPLLRAGLEGATLALWLLGPSSRAERVRRRMVMHVMDARNEDQAVGNFGGLWPSAPVRVSLRPVHRRWKYSTRSCLTVVPRTSRSSTGASWKAGRRMRGVASIYWVGGMS